MKIQMKFSSMKKIYEMNFQINIRINKSASVNSMLNNSKLATRTCNKPQTNSRTKDFPLSKQIASPFRIYPIQSQTMRKFR